MRYQLVLLTVCTLVGCAAPRPVSVTTITIDSPYDSAGAVKMLKEGNNTIKGNAFMRQQGGGVVTCAGQSAELIPATEYAKKRIETIYSSLERGVSDGHYINFSPQSAAYLENRRKVQCDSQGNFVFDGVADGDFFLVAQVTWRVGNGNQGGGLMHRVITQGGKTTSLVMSP